MPHHLWIRAVRRSDRARLLGTLDLPAPVLPPVDAHRRLRGPYTAAGAVCAGLVPGMLERTPRIVAAHDVEVLSVAPDLREVVPATRETLTSLAVPEERTRYYSRLRTLRIAHGLCELLRDWALVVHDGPRTLVVEDVDEADPTDAEWLATLLRRVDPGVLTVVVCSTGPVGHEALADALTRYCEHVTVPDDGSAPGPVEEEHAPRLAAEYVDTDCTSDDPRLRAAYAWLDPDDRAALHDDRADALLAAPAWAPRLGAVPYHRERGADPAGAGAAAVRTAMEYCMTMGFYDATVDLAERGLALVDRTAQLDAWWAFTAKLATGLAVTGRPDEAEAVYDDARAHTVKPSHHLQAAYAAAMLYTRHLDAGKVDHRKAKAWANQAIAFAGLIEDRSMRIMQSVFQRNGLALIEMHMRNLPEALRLVSEGIERLDRELRPDEHRLHRSVLRHNRAQLLAGLGRLEESLADFTLVIEADPNYAEYHLDRGNVLRRLGRDAEALDDYETAIRLSPPFPEVHYNRADVLLSAGDVEAGLAGLDYVLEIDPTFVDAYVNRAGQYAAHGELDAADRDVAAGLALDPANAHLHCVRGQVLAERGDLPGAAAAYGAALELDGALQAAWAGRAAVAFDLGDLAAAIEDLTRAVELGDEAALRYNRATAYRAADRPGDAVADLRRALELAPGDPDTVELLESLGAS